MHPHRPLAATPARRGGDRERHHPRTSAARLRSRARREQAHDRSATRHADAGPVHLHHHARLPDRLHADGDGRLVRLLRLLHGRPGLLRESRLHASGAEDVRGHVQRRAGRGSAIPLHGISGRARQHSRPPVLFAAAVDEERAGRAGGSHADHLRDVRDRHRHRRRGRHADGPAGFAGDAARRLRHQTVGRRGLRRRLPRHPDSAEHSADRLCGDRRRFGGQALCGRFHSGIPAGRALRPLCDGARDHQSRARAEAAARADQRAASAR